MTRLRVHTYGMTIDGYVAGPNQTVMDPMGERGQEIHTFLFADEVHPVDQQLFERGTDGIGATIMGRNMFGPVRGEWGDSDWTGWWGPEPPYHHPVFVLTHHAKDPLVVGDTTFHFVTDGIDAALAAATEVAGGLDVRLGGGCATVQQYLRAGLVDELHLAVVPVVLGAGERLFDGIEPALLAGFERTVVSSPGVAHVVFRR
jgi:dihydrofolate reductase